MLDLMLTTDYVLRIGLLRRLSSLCRSQITYLQTFLTKVKMKEDEDSVFKEMAP